MKVTERRVYRGPNLYAHFPCIRLTLDLEALEDWPSAKIPGFNEALTAALPSLAEHTCSYGAAGGFLRRLREDGGTWLGHVLEHVAIELQQRAGAHVTFGKTRGTGKPAHYHVVFEYEEERVGLAAAELGFHLLASCLPADLRGGALVVPDGFDFRAELEGLISLAQRRQFGPSTASLVRAAEDRDIPWLRLNDYSLVQFGHGRFQRRIQATVTSETRHIAVEIASDKEQTNKILGDLGLPVPRQELVRNAREAVRAAQSIGFPVVVKPYNANHGRGVVLDLMTPEQVEAGYQTASQVTGRTCIVESMITGFDHRMLVVNGELVAVSKRVPGHVVGDGERTIAELVDVVNSDPRRGIGHEKVLTRLELDEQANRLLAAAGHTRDTVLPAGEVFYLRSTGNLSTGGTAIDMTDTCHHDNREMAKRAALAIGLDVAGIDFLCPDVTKSYREVGGAICEVNAAPGFRMHVAPTEGTPRDVAGPVMDMLFPQGTPARIPIASVTGTNGKTTTARMLAHIHKMSGRTVGLTTTDGVYVDGERTFVGDMTGPTSAGMVLRDPTVDLAVLETARGGILRAGLGFRDCNVGCVLNISDDHLGLRGVDTLEQLAEVKRVVVEVARDAAILNADDLLCLRMADHTKAKRIGYFTMNAKNDLVRRHIRAGGMAAVLEEGINGHMITLYDGGNHVPLMWTHLIPATVEGKAMHNVQNALAASLMAYAMDVKIDNIRQGLRTFDTSYFQVPGRTNIYDELAFKVILDYGHNPAAVRAMVDFVTRLDVAGRRLCVLSAPGDRRDEAIVEMATIIAERGGFAHIFLKRDDDPRGRGPTEIPDLLRDALVEHGFPAENVTVIPDERECIDAALRFAERDDLLLIFGDAVSRCWKQVTKFDAKRPEAKEAAPAATLGFDPGLLSGVAASESELHGDLIEDARGVRLARESDD
ncbi:MAG: cyanophycin synthetase [Deltaproteobacteria bacterium]|nr:cyanophycin synthetase [Deltaproteobacteria bacterium]